MWGRRPRHTLRGAAQQKSQIQIVDSRESVRYRGEYEPIDPIAGHIPTAINLPFSENTDDSGMWRSKDEIQKRFKPIILDCDQQNQTIMYCGSGITACHNILATQFASLSMPRLYVGSWSDWINTL